MSDLNDRLPELEARLAEMDRAVDDTATSLGIRYALGMTFGLAAVVYLTTTFRDLAIIAGFLGLLALLWTMLLLLVSEIVDPKP